MSSPELTRRDAMLSAENSGNKKKKSKNGTMIPFCCCAGDSVDAVVGNDEFSPPESRGCTDLIYLIVFVIFCCIMILIAGFAYVYGNPYRLINGMDSFGNVCGTTNEQFGNLNFSGMDMSSKPYVFFFDTKNMERTTKICVEKCPDRDLHSIEDLKEFYMETGTNLCRYDYIFDSNEKETSTSKTGAPTWFKEKVQPSKNFRCPKLSYKRSIPILKRCIPKVDDVGKRLFFNVYQYLNNLNIFKKVLGDLAVTWVTVLGLTTISFVVSFFLVVLIHWITGVIANVIMIAACVLSTGLTAFLWWTYADITIMLARIPLEERLEESIRNKTAFLTYSVLATIFTIFLIFVVLVLRKRVSIVVQLFREAGAALLAMPCLVIQPVVTYITLTGFFCVWLYVILCLATSDIPIKKKLPPISLFEGESGEDVGNFTQQGFTPTLIDRQNRTIEFEDIAGMTLIEYSDSSWVKYMWWIYIIGLVWCSEFILACQQMVIASSVAAWYFTRDRGALKCVILESIVRLIKYHVGSVALGSFVITIVKVPRLILSFTDRMLHKWEDSWTGLKWVKQGCVCCLAAFESCLKYIHHNAYTVIAIQGVDFCPASRLAFSALVQNALQVAVINSTGDFVLFLTKCITAALTGLIALLIFRTDESLYFYAIPTLLTVVFSYFVAHCVISVFEMAVDTLFLCFCEDHNMNDGTDGKEFYAPESLYKYMTEDVVDALAPGRRPGYSSSEKKNLNGMELSEAIPMNSPNSTSA